MLRVALLLAHVSIFVAAENVTPIQKVIQMLSDMKAKGTQERQDEQVRFAAFENFCKSESGRKTKSITEGKESIEQLKADIQKAESDVMVATKEIASLDKDMATWEADKKEAEEIRAEAHATFEEAHEDYTTSIDAVERALALLKAGPSSASLAQTSLLELSSMKRISSHAKKVFMSFIQEPNVLLQDAADAANSLGSSAPEAKAFESSSGGVIDMVTELGAKFEDEKTELEKKESEESHAHNMMVQSLVNQIKGAKQERGSAVSTKATREQEKAAAEGDLADTTNGLNEDEKFLAELTAECEQKTADFQKRQEVRQEELDAIQKAIEIMSGDAVQGGSTHLPSMVQTATSLVQLRSASSSQRAIQGVVASFLAEQARNSDSRVLQLIASKVSQDPFKKVTKMIKDMIFKLMEEAAEEAEHKGFCDTELTTNKQTRDTKTEDAATLKAEIEKLGADISKLGEEVAELSAAVSEIDAAVAKATQERTEEKSKNQATIADATAGEAAVQQAIEVLKAFYDKAGSFVQTSGALGPEMESGEYTGMGGGGVLGMLEVCESDFARLLSETQASEEDAANAFSEFSSDSAVDKATKEATAKHKAGMKQQKESALAAAKTELVGVQEELDAALQYYEKLKPSCIDAGESYEERVARRKAEIESLQEAMKILSS
eukprot:gnl/MRDRNA2_/MRDRNA2_60503_c0_seq1.p1 gnl/MRDRNA2_/MRDRNA2_60503_c0~~gnl/MRDRNA2_/MRDRNA2_60503_c0_seq1.p1  ORF type:complete len:666 (-),score=233.57 gnl/MRDRNA2_/MRDRNA2_60503_c0_seq1:22-2019(-)